MEIAINENLTSTVERLASERNITATEYITNYVNAHLLSQYKQSMIDKITNKTVEDLVTMETAVSAVDATIKVRDDAKVEPFKLPE